MKYSDFFVPTQKEKSSEAKIKSHILMIKSGMVRQETSGIYSWLPLGYRVLKKIINVIEKIHETAGINQILMPTIQSAEIWRKSNRYDTYGKEMLERCIIENCRVEKRWNEYRNISKFKEYETDENFNISDNFKQDGLNSLKYKMLSKTRYVSPNYTLVKVQI